MGDVVLRKVAEAHALKRRHVLSSILPALRYSSWEESILQIPNKAKDHPILRIQRYREVKVELVGAAVVAFAFDDVEGEAEEEVFGCGSYGEGVGYIIVCIIFPPALLAIPVVGYFWFKAAELEMQEVQLQAQLEAQEEAERFREEMRERMDEMEERRGDDGDY